MAIDDNTPDHDGMTPGQRIAAEAFKAFERWCSEYDPEGKMDIIELVKLYNESR